MKLMIVESPSKAKTIEKMLKGQNILVRASFGHIRQLAQGKPREEVVNVNKNFEMAFELTPRSTKEVKELIRMGKDATEIILASDPDREGEAIAWHLQEVLRKGGVKAPMKRVVYHEVTAQAVMNAINNPTELNMDLVHAQKVRQALDYLVGFYLSPVLWSRIASGLSAGRVQSPALKLLAQRDAEIKEFVPKDFWSLSVATAKDKFKFMAKLTEAAGETYGNQDINTKELAETLTQKLVEHMKAGDSLVVESTQKKMKTVRPKPPYNTSVLQQDGVSKLGYSSKKTMELAQKLFEGAGGDHGYISYHRTDAVNLSDEALQEIFKYGNKHYAQYMMKSPYRYTGKSKNSQEAHEAIRPTDMSLDPQSAKRVITDPQQFRLYEMIWQRTMACQMLPAQLESTIVTFRIGDMALRTSGSVVVFPGYQIVYTDGADMDKEDEENPTLPKMDKGDKLPINDVLPKAHQTKGPPLFNEGSMVKALETYGIGRPSTYATIPSTLADRGYVTLAQNRFSITEMGLAVIKYLDESFAPYVDYGFTADLENKLDDVAHGKTYHETLLHEFWNPFKKAIDASLKDGPARGVLEDTGEVCSKCGVGTIRLMVGKYGKYKSCSNYKKCDYRENLSEKPVVEKRYVEGESCPECNGPLVIRKGFKGKDFVGCDNYPTCKYIKSDRPKPEDTGKMCPKCKKHHIVKREGRRGPFYACSGFPKCKHIVADEELATLK